MALKLFYADSIVLFNWVSLLCDLMLININLLLQWSVLFFYLLVDCTESGQAAGRVSIAFSQLIVFALFITYLVSHPLSLLLYAHIMLLKCLNLTLILIRQMTHFLFQDPYLLAEHCLLPAELSLLVPHLVLQLQNILLLCPVDFWLFAGEFVFEIWCQLLDLLLVVLDWFL
jgi:hypothetical protein